MASTGTGTGSAAPAGRPLGGFETALTLSHEHAPFVTVVALRLDGGPPPDRLRDALAELQRRYPSLRVRIAADPAGYRFAATGSPAPLPVPLRLVPRRGDATWLQVVDEELNQRVDAATGPLLRAVYVVPAAAHDEEADGGDGRELVLTFHHAVMDAACARRMVDELLAAACGVDDEDAGETADRTATAHPAHPATLPPPAEAFFPAPFQGWRGGLRLVAFLARQVADEIAFRLRSRGGRRPPVGLATACRPLPVHLSEAATAALVRATRRARVTVNAAVAAALLLAVWRRLYDGRPRPLRYVVFVDLRPHLAPPVDDSVAAAYLTMLRFTARLDGGTDFWSLARRITTQTDAALRRGDRFTALRTAAPMMRAMLSQKRQRMAATATSYGGPVRLRPAYGGTAVRALHVFAGNFGLGPEYTAQGRIFQGELCLDVVYLDVDLSAAGAGELAGDVLDILRRAGDSAGPS